MKQQVAASSDNFDKILLNYETVQRNIKSTNKDHIKLMMVTKNTSIENINFLISKGISLIGENRVQEFLEKYEYYLKPVDIHFIGTLQTNKVKYIINKVSMIESCDSLKLAEVISNLALKNNIVMDILLQVNIGKESTKSGFYQENLIDSAIKIQEFAGVNIRGLMTIGTKGDTTSEFIKMKNLFNELNKIINIDTLSCGMSNDYVEAILNGATTVRIGSGLFK